MLADRKGLPLDTTRYRLVVFYVVLVITEPPPNPRAEYKVFRPRPQLHDDGTKPAVDVNRTRAAQRHNALRRSRKNGQSCNSWSGWLELTSRRSLLAGACWSWGWWKQAGETQT
jgi:hypothetical protein